MSSGIRLRRTCSSAAPTCARFKRCWATPISRRRRSIRTCSKRGCERSTIVFTLDLDLLDLAVCLESAMVDCQSAFVASGISRTLQGARHEP